jgi:hypothetical protein
MVSRINQSRKYSYLSAAGAVKGKSSGERKETKP